MAGDTYYFCFSLIFVLGIILWLVNLLLLRTIGKTTFGIKYKAGTPEHKRVTELARNRNLAITAFASLAFTVNLVYCVNRLVHLNNPKYPQGLLVLLAAFVIFMFILMIPIGRHQARIISEMGAQSRKK